MPSTHRQQLVYVQWPRRPHCRAQRADTWPRVCRRPAGCPAHWGRTPCRGTSSHWSRTPALTSYHPLGTAQTRSQGLRRENTARFNPLQSFRDTQRCQHSFFKMLNNFVIQPKQCLIHDKMVKNLWNFCLISSAYIKQKWRFEASKWVMIEQNE